MCAILDANVVYEVFGSNRTGAGVAFFNWINTGTGNLVASGKVLKELNFNSNFRTWWQQATLAGKIRIVNEDNVNRKSEALQNEVSCRSDDLHVIALAQVSGARLLYSKDNNLQQDFKNKTLIDGPRGKVYSTLRDQSFTNSHRRLLRRNDLCPSCAKTRPF